MTLYTILSVTILCRCTHYTAHIIHCIMCFKRSPVAESFYIKIDATETHQRNFSTFALQKRKEPACVMSCHFIENTYNF